MVKTVAKAARKCGLAEQRTEHTRKTIWVLCSNRGIGKHKHHVHIRYRLGKRYRPPKEAQFFVVLRIVEGIEHTASADRHRHRLNRYTDEGDFMRYAQSCRQYGYIKAFATPVLLAGACPSC
jgi:hypothetical protein